MLVPLGWLEEWIDVPAPEELSRRLTDAGLEIDSIEQTGVDLSALRVGHVIERNPHPDADRLSLCKVDVGEAEPVPIVCGAPNVDAGQKVAVALPGTCLPDGTKLKKSKIRGQVSMGMICSESELGLGEGHDGILVLETEAEPGTPLDQVVRSGETVLEVAITANRGDCTSMLGIAREVRALCGGTLRMPECAPAEGARSAGDDLRVSIEAGDGCHAYYARVVRGVEIGPSPDWMAERLEAAGLRPINCVVDVTNYVMLEFGQPLHAFDLAKLEGGEIRVRRAVAGETFETLDGGERKLEPSDLVIADGRRSIGIAGVMGGANSEVSDKTTDVVIESAHFDPGSIRHTARRLNLNSDASYRFARGVDAQGVRRAADRAAKLLAELAGGQVSSGVVEARGEAPERVEEIRLEVARINRLLGTQIETAEVREILERLGIECDSDPDLTANGETLRCKVPSHRNDLVIVQDLIEEVARVYGFDRIPAAPSIAELLEASRPSGWVIADEVRGALVADGLVEVATVPFMRSSDLDALSLESDDPRRETLAVLNPIVDSDDQLQSTLVPSLLRIVRENANRQVDDLAVFEVANVFRRSGAGELPAERLAVGAVLTQGGDKQLWDPRERVPLFYTAKGIAERLVARLGREVQFRAGGESYHHPGACCELLVANQVVGVSGEIHPGVAAAFGIESPCALVEVDLSAFQGQPRQDLCYREVSRHPRVRRDLAVLLDRDQPAGEVVEAIRKQAGANLVQVDVFDRYEGDGVPDGKVSLAFRLVFQRADRTLTDAEVSKATDRIVQMVAHRFGGALR